MKAPVPGYDGYTADEDGIIYGKNGRPLKPKTDKRGYKQIVLYEDGKSHMKTVHSIIMLTFVGERPAGADIDHIDYDKANNRLSNLRYISHDDNMKHTMERNPTIEGRHICQHKTGYSVQINYKGKIHSRYAKTYEDALRIREELYEQLNYPKKYRALFHLRTNG